MLERGLIEYLKECGSKYGIKVLKRMRSPDLLVELNGDVKKAEVEVQTSRYDHPNNYADLVITWIMDKPLAIPVIQIDHDDFKRWETSRDKYPLRISEPNRVHVYDAKEVDFTSILANRIMQEKDEIVERLEFLRTKIYKTDVVTFYRDVFPMILEDRGILTINDARKIFRVEW